MMKPKISEKSPRLFASDILEMLSRVHPALVVILYLPLAFGLLWSSYTRYQIPLGTTLLLAAAGAVAWTLVEYWLHRAFMHWIPKTEWGERMHFWVHGIHHEWPDDPYRLVMPPSISLVLFFLFLALWWSLMGNYSWAFHGGFTLGYLVYDMAHYFYHHSRPKSSFLKALQRHHLLHHFNRRYENRNFSITVPFWDRFFGTGKPE